MQLKIELDSFEMQIIRDAKEKMKDEPIDVGTLATIGDILLNKFRP